LDLIRQVQNEGYSVLRLCKELTDFIQLGRLRKTHLHATNVFVDHIRESLEAVNVFVRSAIEGAIQEPLAKAKLREFDLIKKTLKWLYVFTKEAIDADTLSIPHSLTVFLNHLVKKIQGCESASLVVLGSSNLMYYKCNLGDLRDLTSRLHTIIRLYPVLREDIGMLKFPYSAAQDVLANCVLFHEMGHYIYENTGLQKQFSDDVEKDIDNLIKRDSAIIQLTPFPLSGRKWLINEVGKFLLRWSDEIFADIFAIRILGPAFHLAFLEMEQILPANVSRNTTFSKYPADFYRFKLHIKWLSKEGWEDIIKHRTPSVFKQLRECEKLNVLNNDFSIKHNFFTQDSEKNKNPDSATEEFEGFVTTQEKNLHKWIFEEFEKFVSIIEGDISNKISGFENAANDFNKYDSFVTSYLKHGVVPSTIYNDQKQECHPNPTTMLNSGFFFYLGEMESLLKMVINKDSDIDKRMNYEKRLNDWLAKGIEDWHVLQEK
jgi:hypothetical protein